MHQSLRITIVLHITFWIQNFTVPLHGFETESPEISAQIVRNSRFFIFPRAPETFLDGVLPKFRKPLGVIPKSTTMPNLGFVSHMLSSRTTKVPYPLPKVWFWSSML